MTEQSGGIRVMQDRRSWLKELSHRLGYLRDETPSDAIEERDVLEAAREIVERRALGSFRFGSGNVVASEG